MFERRFGNRQSRDGGSVVQFTPPPGSGCSIQIGKGLTDAPVGSLRDTYLVVTDIDATRNRLLEPGVEVGRSGTRRPLEHGMGVLHAGSTPLVETMPASPTSPIPMAISGCYRNGAIEMSEVMEAS